MNKINTKATWWKSNVLIVNFYGAESRQIVIILVTQSREIFGLIKPTVENERYTNHNEILFYRKNSTLKSFPLLVS